MTWLPVRTSYRPVRGVEGNGDQGAAQDCRAAGSRQRGAKLLDGRTRGSPLARRQKAWGAEREQDADDGENHGELEQTESAPVHGTKKPRRPCRP